MSAVEVSLLVNYIGAGTEIFLHGVSVRRLWFRSAARDHVLDRSVRETLSVPRRAVHRLRRPPFLRQKAARQRIVTIPPQV